MIFKLPFKKVLCLFLATAAGTIWAQAPDVYSFDFNHLEPGQYNREQVEEALNVSFCKGADEGRVFVEPFVDQGNTLKIKYPEGQVKTGQSGIHTKVPLGQSNDELYISYLVYFPEDFEFRAGGKLPGLAYQTSERNMSLRLMWRYDGLIETYVHYNTRPTREGYKSSINWSLIDPIEEPNGQPQPDQKRFTKGTWHHVEMYHKLNTPGQSDGIMRAWLDGELSLDITDAQDYRQADEGDISMNTIYLSSFFGGTDETFQPTKDVYAYFDDFKVATTRIGPPSGEGEEEEEVVNEAPQVVLTNPLADSTFTAGNVIDIAADATDDGTIEKVVFQINGEDIAEVTAAPYSTSWTPATSGTVTITATVYEEGQENLTASDQVDITITPAETEDDTDPDGDTDTDESANPCTFGTPAQNALPVYERVTFNNIYVLGEGGPDQSNLKKFKINWVPAANGLYSFAFNTYNGVPAYYVDLRGNSEAYFNQNEPSVTISNSGIPGLDGAYWVADDNGNFVMVSQNGGYTIYCSNSDTPPNCDEAMNTTAIAGNFINPQTAKFYPNPVSDGTLTVADLTDETKLILYSHMGIPLNEQTLQDKKSSVTIDMSGLKPGIYVIAVESPSKGRYTKLITKK